MASINVWVWIFFCSPICIQSQAFRLYIEVVFEQQQIKDANRFLELNNSLAQAQNAGALEGRGSGRGNVGRAENLFFKQMDEYTPLYNQFVGAPPSESVSTVISEQDRINRQIAADEAIRAQKRNIAGEEDFMAAEGGIMNLRRKR